MIVSLLRITAPPWLSHIRINIHYHRKQKSLMKTNVKKQSVNVDPDPRLRQIKGLNLVAPPG